jgi:hypothetical protein
MTTETTPLSNRYHLCDRERLRGHIGGTDFGSNTYCIARSPVAALIWNGGGPYWSGRGMQAYGSSRMVGFTRAMLTSHSLINYKKIGENGGRLTEKRIRDAAVFLKEIFSEEDDLIEAIVAAVKGKQTLLIEEGGEAFEPWQKRFR